MKTLYAFIIAASLSPFSFANAFSLDGIADPTAKGHAIAKETEKRDAGFKDYIAQAEMVLKQNDKELSRRAFSSKVLEVEGDGDHSVNVFSSPKDVAGTAILIHAHGLTPDDQWLYLPAVKRVKRISTRSKSGPFVGSEFAYEDISTWVPEKYTYKFLQQETFNGNDCFKVENTPAYADSGYSKLHEWVDAKIFRPRKIDYYDRKGELLKTLNFEDYQLYQGNYWRPSKMVMVNHQTGRSTELLWKDYQFATGLVAGDIVQSKLSSMN